MDLFNAIGSTAVIFAITGFIAWLHYRHTFTAGQQLLWLAVIYLIPILGPIFSCGGNGITKNSPRRTNLPQLPSHDLVHNNNTVTKLTEVGKVFSAA